MALSVKHNPRSHNAPAAGGRRMYDEQAQKKVVTKSTGGSSKVKGVGRIVKTELCPFTMKLSAMLDAGLPVLQCLEALVDQTDNEEFKKVIAGVKEKVEAGDSFYEALTTYPQIFNDLYVKMVSAGEKSGELPEVCSKLAGYMEKSAAIRSKVKSAMMYPTVVIIVAVILSFGLITFVVPKFAEMFSGFGSELPAPTQFLVDLSGFIKSYWYLILGGLVGAIYGFKAYKKTKAGELAISRLILKLPVVGVIADKVIFGRMSRTFASLMQSGMPILQAVEICAETAGNAYISGFVFNAKDDIEQGCTLSESFEKQGCFPSMMMHMIRAGEKTACIETMLEKVADFYEGEVDDTLEGLQSMLEPLLMVGIGTVVGGIVICMFLPIFKMGEMVG